MSHIQVAVKLLISLMCASLQTTRRTIAIKLTNSLSQSYG